MHFQVIGKISNVTTIAETTAIRERDRLVKRYGIGRWKKRKGVAYIRFSNGITQKAELHWYEAHGIGRKEIKIKRFLAEEL